MGQHHSMDEMSEEMRSKLEEHLKKDKAEAKSPKFGATGEYPEPPLDRTDEGQISFGVTSHRGNVIINFGKPVAWLGMNGVQALALAEMLMKHAIRCRDLGAEQRTEAVAKEHA